MFVVYVLAQSHPRYLVHRKPLRVSRDRTRALSLTATEADLAIRELAGHGWVAGLEALP